jgi:hypothetical protein
METLQRGRTAYHRKVQTQRSILRRSPTLQRIDGHFRQGTPTATERPRKARVPAKAVAHRRWNSGESHRRFFSLPDRSAARLSAASEGYVNTFHRGVNGVLVRLGAPKTIQGTGSKKVKIRGVFPLTQRSYQTNSGFILGRKEIPSAGCRLERV